MGTIVRILLLTFGLITMLSQFSWGGEYDFRKAKWGMSKEKVTAYETIKPMEGKGWEREDFLGYKISILGKDVLLGYFFIQNKLIRAKYMLMEKHSNKNMFIKDYEDFKKVLSEKYGKAKDEEVIWLNDLYKDDYSDWGFAISLGHLAYYSKWETPNTTITCFLYGENYDITCGVEYGTKNCNLLNIVKESEKKKKMEDF